LPSCRVEWKLLLLYFLEYFDFLGGDTMALTLILNYFAARVKNIRVAVGWITLLNKLYSIDHLAWSYRC